MNLRLLYFILLIFVAENSFSQNTSCVDSSTRFLLQASTSKINVRTTEVLADSSVIIVGTIRDANQSANEVFLSRLDKNNNILFSKIITGFTGSPHKVIELNNGDILVSAMTYIPGSKQTPWLFRFSNNGNLIWQKQIEATSADFIWAGVIENLYENSSGNIYFGTTSNRETDPIFATYTGYYHVYKLDPLGNGIWKTTIAQIDNGVNHINAIIEENGIVSFITQQFFAGSPYCGTTNSKSVGLFTLQDNNGSFINSKEYCLNFNINGCLGSGSLTRHDAKFMPDGRIIISGKVAVCGNSYLFTLETDQNFNVLNCQRYNYVVPYDVSTGITSIDQYGQVSLNTRGFSTNHILYATFTLNGNIIRERKLSLASGSINSTGVTRFAYRKPDQFLIFSNLNNNGNEALQVMEFKGNNNGTADCTGKDTTFITSAPHTVAPISFTMDTIRTESFIPVNSNYTLTDFSFQRTEVCSSISICDSLRISGNGSVCLNSPDQLFIATRNPGCNKVPLWKIDTSAIYSMQLLDDDTSVVVKFKRQWQGYLYAYSNSCGNLLDSFYINVFASPPPINLGRDTTFCGNTILDAGAGFTSYKWQDNSANQYFTAIDTGLYYVEATDLCGNIYTDSIYFKSKKDFLYIGNDSCVANFPLTITASSGFESYQWQNGSSNNQISITSPGLYYVDTRNSCNEIFTDSIHVYKKIQPFSLGVDTALCPGKSVLLQAPTGFQQYQWQDGTNGNNFLAASENSYYVTVTDFCGNVYSDTIQVTQLDKKVNLGADISICKRETVQLTAKGNFISYNWSPSYNINSTTSQTVILNPEISTTYFVEAATSEGCLAKDTITILVKDCPQNFYIPSAFTPNNDGRNDLFKPIVTAPLEKYEFSIFNRWGQRIFYSTNILKGWDGKLSGQQQDNAVFVWTCTYKFYDKPAEYKKGSFTLVR